MIPFVQLSLRSSGQCGYFDYPDIFWPHLLRRFGRTIIISSSFDFSFMIIKLFCSECWIFVINKSPAWIDALCFLAKYIHVPAGWCRQWLKRQGFQIVKRRLRHTWSHVKPVEKMLQRNKLKLMNKDLWAFFKKKNQKTLHSQVVAIQNIPRRKLVADKNIPRSSKWVTEMKHPAISKLVARMKHLAWMSYGRKWSSNNISEVVTRNLQKICFDTATAVALGP